MLGLKYTKKHYETKINKLEIYAGQIQRHLNILEGYEQEINNFWNDEQGIEYAKRISKAIIGCRNALDRVEGVKVIYAEAFGSLEKTDEGISEALGDIDAVMGALGIEGDK